MKTVITYGTFDLFHVGHLNLLRRAKELGDYLIVAVSSDEFNLGKNKVCKIKDTDRMKIVEAIKYVDKVIPETSWEQKIEDVKKYNVDVFVMGDDWKLPTGRSVNFTTPSAPVGICAIATSSDESSSLA